ncbi:MAG: CBS domain-containing protein [Planctomycetota bacterium]|jgi:CBS domain-containing protein
MSSEQEEEERRYEESAAEEARRLDSRILKEPVRVLDPEPAVSVAPDDDLRVVVQRMSERGQGCAVVVADDRVVGIFTERDAVVRVLAPGSEVSRLKVKDVMTPDPERLTLEDTLGYALHKMSVNGFRHLPIVDDQGRLVGVISQREGVRYLVDFFPEAVINQPPRSVAQQPPRRQHGG